MRILFVEDSESLQRSVGEGLRRSGYAVDIVDDGKRGLVYAVTSEYDVVILDVMLPGLDGIGIVRGMRDRQVETPVLMLTARDTVQDKVLGLRSGADDYLVKPFDFDELLARLSALTRRRHGARGPLLKVGQLEVDMGARAVRVSGKEVLLTPKELALIEYLAHRAGKPVSRSELEEHLYDERAQLSSNAVDVTVYSLRGKLDAAGAPGVIHTRRGYGYVLSEEGAG